MKFVVKRDKRREYRWRLLARNGRIIAVSGEGYKRRCDAVKGIHRVRESCNTPILIVR
jgi:uncharacterized protein